MVTHTRAREAERERVSLRAGPLRSPVERLGRSQLLFVEALVVLVVEGKGRHNGEDSGGGGGCRRLSWGERPWRKQSSSPSRWLPLLSYARDE